MNLGKNMILSTWGRNENGDTIWYPSFYDCDSILGLANNGKITFGPGLDMDTGDYNTSNSALWTKLQKMFSQEIRDRYRELRMPRTLDGKTLPPIFSAENLMNYYGGQVTQTIGERFYNNDSELKYLIPESKQWVFMCSGNRRQYTERWLKERFVYMDSVYEFNEFPTSNRIILRSNVTGRVKLKIKTYSPMHVLVSFSDSASSKVKLYVDKDRWYEFESNIENGRDNNISISGAHNIMFVDGIKDLNASFINIGEAKKIVDLDCSDSQYIQQIKLGDNTYLQTVKCMRCPNLGLKLEDKVLDLEKCINLRYLDCSNTKLGSIKLNTKGGVLDYLNCSNTYITTFFIAGQEYLTELELSNCPELSELTVDNCNGLTRVSMPNTKLSKFFVTGCDLLTYVDISQTKFLERLDLRGCPNLHTLKMKGVSNKNLTELDLSTSLNLEYLDVSSNSFLEHIVFGRYVNENGETVNFNKLKHFDANTSTIKTFRYGKSTPIPEGLNLAGLSLTYFDVSNCTDIVSIANLNYYANTSSAPFRNCKALVSIQGYISLTGSINRGFFGCENLTTLPSLDLSRVSSMSETFENCKKITMANASYIMDKVGPTLTALDNAFGGCINIRGSIPPTFFNKCSNVRSIAYLFIGCSLSGELHVDLFKPMLKLTNMTEAFYDQRISGNLHEDLFKYNTEMTHMPRAFGKTNIQMVPPTNFFREMRKLQQIYGLFQYCTDITGTLNDRWFVSLKDLTHVNSMFQGCPNIMGTIPADIFNNIVKYPNPTNNLVSVSSFIQDTSITGQIPPTLFSSCHKLDNLQALFKGTNIVGNIPETLLANCPRITKMPEMFSGCNGLTGFIPKQIFSNKGYLQDITGMFYNCSGLEGDIPKAIFDDCTKITDISNLFNGCTGITGQIPKRVSEVIMIPDPDNPELEIPQETIIEYGIFDKCTNIVNAKAVFKDCVNIRSEIPETLFINATKVTDMSEMFKNCVKLYGPIPSKLFSNCFQLQDVSSFFGDCVGISEYLIDEDNPYCIPDDLFSNCFNLLKVDYFLGMIAINHPHAPKLKGELPPNLFRFNTKLTSAYALFWGCGSITGTLPDDFFKYTTKIENLQRCFSSIGITAVGQRLLTTNPQLRSLESTFEGCSKITSQLPPLWNTTATAFSRCFSGCSNASNYNTIPNTWK